MMPCNLCTKKNKIASTEFYTSMVVNDNGTGKASHLVVSEQFVIEVGGKGLSRLGCALWCSCLMLFACLIEMACACMCMVVIFALHVF